MCVLRKMRAVAGALLLSPGLGMASDSAAVNSGPQAVPVQPVSEAQRAMQAIQAWPQMMSMGGAPVQYGAPFPGMMWPMQPQYPVPMAMPSAPPVIWVPFMWVLIPAEAPGLTGASYGPVANTPVVKLPPLNAAPAPPSTESAASITGAAEASKVNTSPVAGADGAALPLAAALSAGGLPEPAPLPAVPSADEKDVNFDSIAPALVVKPLLSDAVPVTVTGEATTAAVAAEIDKVSPIQTAGIADVAEPPLTGLMASPVVEPSPTISAPTITLVSEVAVDYGPVAPTPVVDLLALMQPTSPPARAPAKRKAVRKPSVSIPLKPRPTATAKPVKPRMCWTKGVVAPCR